MVSLNLDLVNEILRENNKEYVDVDFCSQFKERLSAAKTKSLHSLYDKIDEKSKVIEDPRETEPPFLSPVPLFTVIEELLNFALPILPASFEAAIEPANIVFETEPVSPVPTRVPVATGNVNTALLAAE